MTKLNISWRENDRTLPLVCKHQQGFGCLSPILPCSRLGLRLPLTRHQQPPSTCQSSCLCGPAGSQMCDIRWGLKKLNSPEFHFSPTILFIYFFSSLTMLQLHLGCSCAKGLIGTNGARNLEGVEGTKRVQGQQLEHGLGPVAMGCAAPRAVPAVHPLPWYSHDGNLSRFRHGRTAGCLSN